MKIRKIVCGVLAAVLFIIAVAPNISKTKGYNSFTTIISFEQTNPVFEESVDFGTTREQLNLPATLRAVVELTTSPPSFNVEVETEDPYGNYRQVNTTSRVDLFLRTDATSPPSLEVEPGEEGDTGEGFVSNEFWQMYPSGENMDYEQFGYTAPENAEELWNNEQLVIFTFVNGNGDTEYRVYGTIDGENQGFFACDQYGNIFGIVVNIPITWEGEYDGETPGEYVLEAVADGYSYNDEMPTAIITVQAQPPEVEEDLDNSLERDGQGVIAAFEPLDDAVLTQNVRNGTPLEDLTLPAQLFVILETETDTDTNTETDTETETDTRTTINVTWAAAPEYYPYAQGTYVFTAVVSEESLENENLQLAEDIELPRITVNVEPAPIRVTTRDELFNVIRNGAISGGSDTWSGERIVIVADNISGSQITTSSPPVNTTRTITLRTDDTGQQRNLTTTGVTVFMVIEAGVTVIIDDENLHVVGNNPNPTIDGPEGGGIRIGSGGILELKNGTIRNVTDHGWGENAVFVGSGGTFNMYGGEIRDNRAEGGAGVFIIYTGATFNMYGGTIKNNYARDSGAGVRVGQNTTFNMYGGNITNNYLIGTTASGGGGVFVINNGVFNMHGGTIEGNTITGTSLFGGGVFVESGNNSTFNMNGGIIKNNTAPRGGGVAVRNSFFNLGTGHTGSGAASAGQTGTVGTPTIQGNTATGDANASGGGVFIVNSSLFNMYSGTIEGNRVTGLGIFGGGVFVDSVDTNTEAAHTTFNMNGGIIQNNTAPRGGGVAIRAGVGNGGSRRSTFNLGTGREVRGIAPEDQTGPVNNPRIISNTSTEHGGGVYVVSMRTLLTDTTSIATFTMHRGEIAKNTASQSGGGVRVEGLAVFNMREGTIQNNTVNATSGTADFGGGGVYVLNSALFNMNGGIIEGNKVEGSRGVLGGGVFVDTIAVDGGATAHTTFNMNGGTIQNNTAPRGGGVAVRGGFGNVDSRRSTFNLGTGRDIRGVAPENQIGPRRNPTIIKNTATGGDLSESSFINAGYPGGGGVYVVGMRDDRTNTVSLATFTMHSGYITNNETPYRGGGVFISRRAIANIRGAVISGNRTIENNNNTSLSNTSIVPLVSGGGIYLHSTVNISPIVTISGTTISNNHSRNGGGIARDSAFPNFPVNITGQTVISGNIAERLGGGIYPGEPAPRDRDIGTNTVQTHRLFLVISNTVEFTGNRSRMPDSHGLTVAQVRSFGGTVNSNIQWNGLNSAGGRAGVDDDFHLFNNHDIANLQGKSIILERAPDDYILAISKTVAMSDNFGHDLTNKNQYFTFEITINSADNNNSKKYKAYVLELGENNEHKVVTSEENYVGIISADVYGDYTELEAGVPARINLKHGQWLSFVDIEPGASYKVKEIGTPYYIAVSSQSKDGGDPTVTSGEPGKGHSVYGTISSGGMYRVDFTNVFDIAVSVGINVDDLPFIIVFGFGLLALIGFVTVKTYKGAAKM